MEIPLELAFHGLDHSDWAATEIRKRVGKLVRLHDRMTAVRVRVELEGRQHRTGNLFVVRIEMRLPGSGSQSTMRRRSWATDACCARTAFGTMRTSRGGNVKVAARVRIYKE